jgi:ABC-type glutathione transport system ATPase component
MLEIRNLSKQYVSEKNRGAPYSAVDAVSFTLHPGEIVGLIGESGCGKTSVAKLAAGLMKKSAGEILLGGEEISSFTGKRRKAFCRKVQIMFQNPESSLDPQMKAGSCIAEVLRLHHITERNSAAEKAMILELMDMVGLQKEHLDRYTRELSGGQIQRVVLARVLALKPEFLIADEPTSMLDVSVQAQILTLLNDLRRELNFAVLLISHDLDVIRVMCDRVLIMHEGKMVDKPTA